MSPPPAPGPGGVDSWIYYAIPTVYSLYLDTKTYVPRVVPQEPVSNIDYCINSAPIYKYCLARPYVTMSDLPLLWDLHTDEGLYKMRRPWSHLRREGHERGMNPASVQTNTDRTELEVVFS